MLAATGGLLECRLSDTTNHGFRVAAVGKEHCLYFSKSPYQDVNFLSEIEVAAMRQQKARICQSKVQGQVSVVRLWLDRVILSKVRYRAVNSYLGVTSNGPNVGTLMI